jgi:hypothetical protein
MKQLSDYMLAVIRQWSEGFTLHVGVEDEA